MHTYTSMPQPFSKILKSVSTDVSTNLVSELGVDVKYKHNSFTKIMNELADESTKSEIKNDRYPLIALIQPFTTTQENKGYNVKCDILIATMEDDEDKTSDDRESDNYNTILRPIYAELISQLSKHRYISHRPLSQPKHEIVDIYNFGDDLNGSKNSVTLPDRTDVLVIKGIELFIHDAACGEFSCVPPTVELFDMINEVSMAAHGSTVQVVMNAASFINNSAIDTEVDYTLDWGDSNSEIITQGTTYTHQYPEGENQYIITITSNYGSQAQLFAWVNESGNIDYFTRTIAQSISYDLDCTLDPDYTTTLNYNIAYNEPSGFNVINVSDFDGTVLYEGNSSKLPISYIGSSQIGLNHIVVNAIGDSLPEQITTINILTLKN